MREMPHNKGLLWEDVEGPRGPAGVVTEQMSRWQRASRATGWSDPRIPVRCPSPGAGTVSTCSVPRTSGQRRRELTRVAYPGRGGEWHASRASRWRGGHGRDLEVLQLGPGSPALVLVHPPAPGQGPGYMHRASPAPCWHLAGPSRWLGQCWLSGALASGQAGSGMIWATCRRLQGPTGGIHPQRAGSQRVPRPVGDCGGPGWPGTGWALSRPQHGHPIKEPSTRDSRQMDRELDSGRGRGRVPHRVSQRVPVGLLLNAGL